jgi:hypothetical protein
MEYQGSKVPGDERGPHDEDFDPTTTPIVIVK